jgi:hypothetical protein
MVRNKAVSTFSLSLWVAGSVVAQTPPPPSLGEGAIVIAEEAPVYKDSTGDELTYTLKLGEAVAARISTARLLLAPVFRFKLENGRTRVNYFPREEQWADSLSVGWVDPAVLSKFHFDCCDLKRETCSAITPIGVTKSEWSVCFQEARDAHLLQLDIDDAPPITIDLGFSEEQVQQALGKPTKILKLGARTVWVYSDLRITFENGQVADMQ